MAKKIKEKKRIMLVEDDEAIVELYETTLKGAGFEVENFGTGSQCMAKLKEMAEGKAEKPDLLLLDLILPDMNGMEILEKIRKCEQLKMLPVFILTNYTPTGLDLSGEKVLLKTDFTPTQLLEVVKKRLGE